jgi:hypothetical protein
MKDLSLKQFNTWKWVIFIFCFTILVTRTFTVSVFDGNKARSSVYGDGYSDINTISSAKYFLDSGFTQTAFLPVHDYYPELKGTNAYTHYPALPNILAGFYANMFGTVYEPVLRLVPMLIAVLFFVFIFFVIYQITQNRIQTLLGAASILLASYFLTWADNLHQHLYGELLKWIYFYLLYTYFMQGCNNKRLLAALFFIMLIQVNISFEQPVYLGILTLGFSIIFKKRIFTIETVGAAAFVVIGFILHLFQNAIYFNSWDLALTDMKDAFLFRTAGTETAQNIAESAFGPADYWQIPFSWFNRMERFYMFPGWAVLILAFWVMKELRATNKNLYQILWALFFASIAWTICMAQHGFIHIFVNKHFSIWYALIVAIGLPILWQKVKMAFTQKTILPKVLYSLLCLYMIVMFLTQQVWMVYLKFGIAYKWLN